MDHLALIYNENQWRINAVSPLNNLHFNEVKLKQYATTIKQHLVRAVFANASIKFTVSFEELPYLKFSPEDPNGILLSVKSIKESKTKTAYEAIFLTWGTHLTLTDAIHLPYMLERGEQRVGVCVKSSLQNIFDCNIKEYNFSQLQLLQIGLNFLNVDTSKSSDLFIIGYKIPQTDITQKVSFKFEIGEIRSIWNSLKRECSNELELVQVMYQNLQNQIFYMITLDVTVFELNEVILPNAEVRSNGTVKIKTAQTINSLFVTLNQYFR
ncbi:uncharacterized protein LOC123713823 [Pieris brassicae]|uniref:Centromere protein L n=1 Tax=Pieris brassicae TaxID=7116 RepID=A0A9P0TIG1_PIEBR|nr:uncharacterized protein LOC123713823 [Pieris brassicae]XP_045523654.1 uncharacterized protein LOC123713823 [Pieris brassicae]CAH4030511.1 unnamed protein product [Pieris brassicae]